MSKGRAYFIDHNTRTTIWNDPRLPSNNSDSRDYTLESAFYRMCTTGRTREIQATRVRQPQSPAPEFNFEEVSELFFASVLALLEPLSPTDRRGDEVPPLDPSRTLSKSSDARVTSQVWWKTFYPRAVQYLRSGYRERVTKTRLHIIPVDVPESRERQQDSPSLSLGFVCRDLSHITA